MLSGNFNYCETEPTGYHAVAGVPYTSADFDRNNDPYYFDKISRSESRCNACSQKYLINLKLKNKFFVFSENAKYPLLGVGVASASNISRWALPAILALAELFFFFKINFSLNLNLNFTKSKTYKYGISKRKTNTAKT